MGHLADEHSEHDSGVGACIQDYHYRSPISESMVS